MLTSFVVTLIECLEIAFITLMLSHYTRAANIYMSSLVGLIAGIAAAYFLHDVLEDYEWAMYAILSVLFFYLFVKSNDIAAHIKEHFEEIESAQNTAIALATVFFVYSRESFEIFSALLLNPESSWLLAGIAALLAAMVFIFARNSEYKRYVFKFGYWAYLAFGIWFGYEALEHLHIL
mgnify:CR=1 FL=1